ncbi:hypothetical protein KCP70_16980 [Salmonella enterica subsp. enterica]|nr:hypothetical protein KCP70_16980 [Salmonella enterica subsp. enterica]
MRHVSAPDMNAPVVLDRGSVCRTVAKVCPACSKFAGVRPASPAANTQRLRARPTCWTWASCCLRNRCRGAATARLPAAAFVTQRLPLRRGCIQRLADR